MSKKLIQKYIFNLGKNKPIQINKTENIFGNCKRILLLRQDRLGDVIISIPFISTLKKKFPNAQIDIVLGNFNYFAKDFISEYIDDFYHYDKSILGTLKLFYQLNQNKYDLIIDLFDNASSTATFFCKFIRAKNKLGLDKENSEVYSHIVPLLDKSKYHIIERVNNLLIAFGINNDEAIDFPRINKKTKTNLVGVNLYGSEEYRFIGVENAIELLSKIHNEFPRFEIILFYQNDKIKTEVSYIAEQSGVNISPPTTSFYEFADIISQCEYLISTDTSSVHLSSLYKIPCLALFQKMNTKKFGQQWLPYGVKYQSVEAKILKKIDIEEAFEKFKLLVE